MNVVEGFNESVGNIAEPVPVKLQINVMNVLIVVGARINGEIQNVSVEDVHGRYNMEVCGHGPCDPYNFMK